MIRHILRHALCLCACLMATAFIAKAQTPPSNEIWYTTTDGKPIIDNSYRAYYSNTYRNGKGVIVFWDDVTDIDFSCCETLETITIPNNAHINLSRGSFSGCPNLKRINWGKCKDGRGIVVDRKLIYVAPGGLTKYTIPNGVTSIGYEAFYDCSKLSSITIPNSVTSIGYKAFYDCSNLTSVYYNGDLSDWCNIDFDSDTSNPLINGTKLYINNTEVTKVTIPSDISEIKNYTFYGCSSLTNVTIGNGVTTIGSSAFSGCSSLINVTIGDSVTEIGGWTFFHCSSLTNITIPDSVISIGKYAFFECSSLSSITIPDSVTEIGGHAFDGCSSLTSITIPNSVTTIGGYAFEDCSSLTSITIPNSVTEIGSGAFADCSSLTSITIPNSVTSIEYEAFKGCSSLTSITIPNSVTEIESSAFSGCSSLTSITIPKSVTSIGSNAFSGCTGELIVNCNIPRTSSNDSNAFYGSNFTKVTIEDGVTTIGRYVFYSCRNLTNITIPDSVTEIGRDAFYVPDIDSVTISIVRGNPSYLRNYFGANKITGYIGKNVSADGCCLIKDGILIKFWDQERVSYSIHNSVTSIGSNAFSGCSSLTSITIPDSVTSIGAGAFEDCSSLGTITIPDSVTSIGNNAFVGCKNLYRMTCYASVPPTIDSFGEYMIIYVPKEAIKAYKQDPNWSRYKKQIKPIK